MNDKNTTSRSQSSTAVKEGDVKCGPDDKSGNLTSAPTFNFLKELVGDDVLEIFGDTGTGKSKFVHALALEALAAGKTVFFLDTERNLSKNDVEKLGSSYQYTPVFSEIKTLMTGSPKKVDLLIIDSIGLPILTRFALLSMKEKGNALLDLIAVVGKLKEWAYQNNALVVITNQPESEFGKSQDEIRRPFGDKAQFAAKEIWLTRKLKTGFETGTKCGLESFRSRSMKNGLSVLQIEITDQGTKIIRTTEG